MTQPLHHNGRHFDLCQLSLKNSNIIVRHYIHGCSTEVECCRKALSTLSWMKQKPVGVLNAAWEGNDHLPETIQFHYRECVTNPLWLRRGSVRIGRAQVKSLALQCILVCYSVQRRIILSTRENSTEREHRTVTQNTILEHFQHFSYLLCDCAKSNHIYERQDHVQNLIIWLGTNVYDSYTCMPRILPHYINCLLVYFLIYCLEQLTW